MNVFSIQQNCRIFIMKLIGKSNDKNKLNNDMSESRVSYQTNFNPVMIYDRCKAGVVF